MGGLCATPQLFRILDGTAPPVSHPVEKTLRRRMSPQHAGGGDIPVAEQEVAGYRPLSGGRRCRRGSRAAVQFEQVTQSGLVPPPCPAIATRPVGCGSRSRTAGCVRSETHRDNMATPEGVCLKGLSYIERVCTQRIGFSTPCNEPRAAISSGSHGTPPSTVSPL